MKNFFIRSFVFLSFSLLLSSCISKKKHLAALELLKADQATVLQQEIDVRDIEIRKSKAEITDLNLQLAERKGENNILVQLREELQTQIAGLENQLENMSSSSSSAQQNLNSNLQQKELEITQLKAVQKEVDKTLARHTSILEQMGNDLRYELQNVNPQQYDQFKFEVTTGLDEINIIVLDEIIFQKKSVTRMKDEGIAVFEKVSEVLQKYPNMSISIIGHTDSTPAKKRDVDNWNVAAQKAASVLRLLTEDLDLNPSSVTLASKGEYVPRESNETTDGKNKNRRIQLRVAPRSEELVKAVRKVLK